MRANALLTAPWNWPHNVRTIGMWFWHKNGAPITDDWQNWQMMWPKCTKTNGSEIPRWSDNWMTKCKGLWWSRSPALPIAIWISDSAMTQIEFFCSAVFSFVPVNRPHCGNLSFIECKWAKWMMMRRSDASFGGGWCDETGNTWRGCFMSSNSSTVVANCDCGLWAGRLIEWLTKTVGAVIVMSWLFASISRLSNLIYFHHVTVIQCRTVC